jgi:uncharacterized membrane protein HdeD (DUF308 family)
MEVVMVGPGGADSVMEERDFIRTVGKSWGWVLFFGIVSLILGILVVIRPKDTVYAVAILLGIWLFVAGLFRIVTAIADHEDSGGVRWLQAFLGILAVIIGILFLRHTDQTVTTLAFLIGIFWVVGGILEFVSAYSDRASGARGWKIAGGVLAFAAGVVTLVWPHLTLAAFAVIMGIWLVIYGLLVIAISFQLRHLAKT